MFQSKKLITLALFGMMSLLGLQGCRTSTVVYVDPYYFAWHDVYGYECSYSNPYPGCNFYADGSKVYETEDPYYMGYYYPEFGYYEYVDSYGYLSSYYGYAWLSPTGILYDSYGYALNEAGQSDDRDLVGQMEQMETQAASNAGKKLAERYALAEDTGIQIAKTLQDYATLGRKRERTDADMAEFSQKLFGVKIDDAKAALKQASSGDVEALKEINDDIAAHWGTSPETSQEILKDWFAKQ